MRPLVKLGQQVEVKVLNQELEMVSLTDPGIVRSHNEDSVYVDKSVSLLILADGMGGYNAGEVASGMATTLLGSDLHGVLLESPGAHGSRLLEWARGVLCAGIAKVNASIYEAAATQPHYAGMGTTLVVALFHAAGMTVAHIGDSRLYRLRGAQLDQLTRDHSLLQEQIDGGIITPEQAKYSQNKNLVTRALGVDPSVVPEIQHYDVAAGDIYLLCSDGLNDMVEDGEIALTLQTLSANLDLCAAQLVQMANDNGGRDNVSVILVKVREVELAAAWWRRLLAWFN